MTLDSDQIDPRDAAILKAAFVVFARYGLRRTSMADIAEGAGMSRPALYLRFSGKEDIFNALVRLHFETSERAVAEVLARDGAAEERLLAAFHAIDGEAVEAMLNSPHGDEMLNADAPFQLPEVQAAKARIAGHIADWIARGVKAGRFSLQGLHATPDEMAATIMAAKFGLKAASGDFAAYRQGQERVAAVFARALAC